MSGDRLPYKYDEALKLSVGYFNGEEISAKVFLDKYLTSVKELGPFTHPNIPIVGTDNYDFMMMGVANIVGNQKDANYASNYHAESDTFDKVDQVQLRKNAAIAATLILGFANDEQRLPRHSRKQIDELLSSTDLEMQMKSFNVWDGWEEGTRGRQN